MDVFYSENIFILGVNEEGRSWLGTRRPLPDRQVSRMRMVQFVASPFEPFPNIFPTRPITELWGPFLARLTFVSLVMGPSQYWTSSIYEHHRQILLEKVEQVAEVIAEYVPGDSYIEVDYNGCKRTAAVIDRCLTHRYHEKQTLAGDKIFERGDYEYVCQYQPFE